MCALQLAIKCLIISELIFIFTTGLDENDFSIFFVFSMHVIRFVVDVELK